jgi:hypothetical protein
MTAPQWLRVRELFEAALEAAPADPHEWLEAQAAEAAVRLEVASLLDHHTQAGAFLEDPIAERAPELLAEDEALKAGATVGHYRITREIGRGAMGRVYLADDVNLGRPVALKALAPHFTGDSSYRERLRREARAAAGMTHPGICTVHALEESDGQLFIVSELIEGHTLRDEIGKGQPPDADAIARTARELADALAAAHASGITHRDFKPENVMRDRSGRLKVLDFGLAYAADSGVLKAGALATMPGVLVGTPAYMAPEQLNGERADARADVFAYGVVVYEYACGTHPFNASTPLGLVARVLESDAPPISDRVHHMPADVAMVIDRCLRKSAAERFGSATEIVAALSGGDAGVSRRRPTVIGLWWRAHQLALMALYLAAAALAWSIKETAREPLTLWVFIALGIGAAVGGTVRAHLLFTSAFNLPRLRDEHMRVRRTLTSVDLLIAAALAADGLWIAPVHPLWGVLTVGLGAGVALATLLMEPATAAATFQQ